MGCIRLCALILKSHWPHSSLPPATQYWLRFPREGSEVTPPHPSGDFKWKDYCPTAFKCAGLGLGPGLGAALPEDACPAPA